MKSRGIDPERRPLQYWYEDGIPEIATGAAFAVFAAWYLVIVLLPQDSAALLVLRTAFAVFVMAIMLVTGRIVQLAKRRVTYPRTGYVAYRKSPGRMKRLIAVAAAIALISIALAVVAEGRTHVHASVVVASVVAGGALYAMGRSVGLSRLRVVGLAASVAGILSGVLIADVDVAFLVLFAAFALALVGDGVVAFVRYLRSEPEDGHGGDSR